MSGSTALQLLTVDDIEALPDLEWLIEGVLQVPALAVLYGDPSCGKTFVALSTALSVAYGGEWLGRSAKPVKVLYIAAEGVLGLKNRIRAHRHRYGIEADNIRFVASPIAVADPKEVAALIKCLADEDFAPQPIVVDTFARVALGVDENSARDMGVVIAGFDELKRSAEATVLIIHHTRKDGATERGSSALRGAADVMIACEAQERLDGAGVRLTCTKMKDDEPFKPFGAILKKVSLQQGRRSLLIGNTFDIFAAGAEHADKIVEILETKFADKGATHGELKKELVSSGAGSELTLARAWRDLKNTDRVRSETINGRARHFAAGVSVSPVSS